MKDKLRKIALEKRKNILNKELKDKEIVKKLNTLIKKYDKIMLYYPIKSEPDILNIFYENNDKQFYLPFCNRSNIEIRYLNDLNCLIKDDVNIYSSDIKTNDEVDVVIAPAVACNNNFYRLGYGGGYYDRFLRNKNVLKIMVVYQALITDVQYQEEFDIQFDYIVTEEEILKKE